jgi:uncharacterized protein (TIGR02466 family)
LESTLRRAWRRLQAGDPAAAVRTCRDILAADPDCLPALNLGAIAAFQGGGGGEAIRLLEHAIARYPDDREAYYNLGVVQQARGEMDRAADNFARAASRDPNFADAQYNHATALMELGRAEDAIAAYERCIGADPGYTPAYSGLAFVLRGLRRFDDAVQAYERGLARQPRDAEALSGLGLALQALNRLPEAQATFERATAIGPDYPEAWVNLADVLIARGNAGAARDVCDRYLARHRADAGVLASKSIALGECGDGRDALVDFDRFLVSSRPEAPAGFATVAALNDALARHILDHPTLIDAPTSRATQDGRHTGELLADDAAPIRAFEALVRDAVANYLARQPAESDSPHLAARPDRWRLTAWSIVLEGRGYQTPHIHPSAWLSGVYYVQVPDIVRDGDPDQAGWIEFGRPGDEYHWTAPPPLRAIKPEPGLMVLFPSYFFHRTIPVAAAGTRISVAFDVLPLA